ncbi:hypothetical protein NA78x_001884 [Anatilimnocola sp. NA78]|uniref:hypothetical protein n=1 Tax=Anatilimnocola sp. NA78 TaxID=3415683 RepID=UPI003CE542D2
MAVRIQTVLWSICCALITGLAVAEPPQAKVEMRWVETKRVEGLTEVQGFQSSCDPDSIVYPHKKPALTLTAKTVADAKLTKHDFSNSGLSSQDYSVTLHLTPEARQELLKTCPGDDTQYLTVVINGKYWGLRRYEKKQDGPEVPTQSQAETFLPDIGFFSSQAEAERLLAAVR